MTRTERIALGLLAVLVSFFVTLAALDYLDKPAPATFLERWSPIERPASEQRTKSNKGPCMSKRLACYA